MNVTAVESSVLRAIAYDENLELLRLEFHSRVIYDYFGVPAAIHDVLLRAPSIGVCFNEIIRGRFSFRRFFAGGSSLKPEGER